MIRRSTDSLNAEVSDLAPTSPPEVPSWHLEFPLRWPEITFTKPATFRPYPPRSRTPSRKKKRTAKLMSAIDPRLLRICENYTRAVLEKDVAGFLALYHPTSRVFDTWGAWSYEGEAARRKIVEEWFSSLGEERVAVTFARVQTVVTSDLATLTARVVYAAIDAQGAELRSMQNRLTWVLKPDGDSWQIIHEHTSVPIGPDLKGLLAREA